MEEFLKLVSNFGFPIVVAAYLLIRLEKKMDDLEKTVSGKDGVLDKAEEILSAIKEYCDRKRK